MKEHKDLPKVVEKSEAEVQQIFSAIKGTMSYAIY